MVISHLWIMTGMPLSYAPLDKGGAKLPHHGGVHILQEGPEDFLHHGGEGQEGQGAEQGFVAYFPLRMYDIDKAARPAAGNSLCYGTRRSHSGRYQLNRRRWRHRDKGAEGDGGPAADHSAAHRQDQGLLGQLSRPPPVSLTGGAGAALFQDRPL